VKLRIRYSKLGKLRFLSHRDVARVWERTIRRAGLPIAYSEGFSPRPRLHFGLALSVGHESVDEYLDVDLREPVELVDLPERLSACLPRGLAVDEVAALPDGARSLQESVDVVVWRFGVPRDAAGDLPGRVAAALAATELPLEVERKGKPQLLDLRPQIAALHLDADDAAPGEVVLVAEMRTRPRSVRPGELLVALGVGDADVRVRRLHQYIELDGVRRSPMTDADPVPATAATG
jgi:radical SAM-linked protein